MTARARRFGGHTLAQEKIELRGGDDGEVTLALD